MNKETKQLSQSVSYRGVVKVSTLNSDREVIKSKTYHNTGEMPLFVFLCQCLAGNYTNAEPARPKYLRLFSLGEAGTAWSSESPLDFSKQKTLVPIFYEGDPRFGRVSDEEEQYSSITIKFLIPYSRLILNDNDDINLFCLYGLSNRDTLTTSIGDNPSAYFVLLDDNDTSKLSTAITKSERETRNANNYSLYVEWELRIGNFKEGE